MFLANVCHTPRGTCFKLVSGSALAVFPAIPHQRMVVGLKNWHPVRSGHSWQSGRLARHTSAPKSSAAQLACRLSAPLTRRYESACSEGFPRLSGPTCTPKNRPRRPFHVHIDERLGPPVHGGQHRAGSVGTDFLKCGQMRAIESIHCRVSAFRFLQDVQE